MRSGHVIGISTEGDYMERDVTSADIIASVLLIAGGLNWLAVAFGLNAVGWLADVLGLAWLATVIYILVGIAALFALVRLLTPGR